MLSHCCSFGCNRLILNVTIGLVSDALHSDARGDDEHAVGLAH